MPYPNDGTSNIPAKIPEVAVLTEQIKAQCDELTKRIEGLAGRLVPIMCQRSTDPRNERARNDAGSPHGIDLVSIRDSLVDSNSKLLYLLESLEI